MGDSLPPPASFDLVGSFARRRGSDVEIVLARPEVTAGDPASVTLRKGRAAVEGPARLDDDAAYGTKLVVRVPRTELSDGSWSLTLRSGNGRGEPLAARLLVQGERPLVLLWGAKGTDSLVPSARKHSSKRRAAASAGRVLDRALNVLPEDKAVQLRARARSTARKVLR